MPGFRLRFVSEILQQKVRPLLISRLEIIFPRAPGLISWFFQDSPSRGTPRPWSPMQRLSSISSEVLAPQYSQRLKAQPLVVNQFGIVLRLHPRLARELEAMQFHTYSRSIVDGPPIYFPCSHLRTTRRTSAGTPFSSAAFEFFLVRTAGEEYAARMRSVASSSRSARC